MSVMHFFTNVKLYIEDIEDTKRYKTGEEVYKVNVKTKYKSKTI